MTHTPAPLITPSHERFIIVDTENNTDWMTERNNPNRITASQAATLAACTPAAWETVRRDKAGESNFAGNEYTDRGHEYEPELLDYARQIDPTIQPNSQLILHKDHPQYAATPDGISTDGRVSVQAKTTNKPLNPARLPRRYRDQIQWELLVTGAFQCIAVIGEFKGNRLVKKYYGYIAADPKRQAELRTIVDRFLSGQPPVEQTRDERLAEAIDEYCRLKEAASALNAEIDQARAELDVLVGNDAGEWSSGTFHISRSAPTPSTRIDRAALEANFPEAYEKVLTTTTTAGTLRFRRS